MAKDDQNSIDRLEIFFLQGKEGVFWFVESKLSNKWITVYDNKHDEIALTNNPDEAQRFETEAKAKIYIIENNLGTRFIATEHEFID